MESLKSVTLNDLPKVFAPHFPAAVIPEPEEISTHIVNLLMQKVSAIAEETYFRNIGQAKEEASLSCNRCNVSKTNKIQSRACRICQGEPFCKDHLRKHISGFHYETVEYQRIIIEAAREMMMAGHMTGLYTRDHALMLTGHQNRDFSRYTNSWNRSPGFALLDECNISRPMLITLAPPENEEKIPPFIEKWEEFVKQMNLRTYLWAPGNGISFLVGINSDVKFLPSDVTIPQDEQEDSASGYVIDTKTPGKTGKRMRLISAAKMAFFMRKPSYLPFIHMPGGRKPVKVEIRDTGLIGNHRMERTAGDGNGVAFRDDILPRLRAAGYRGKMNDLIGIQPNIVGGDFFIKGIILLKDRKDFPGVDPSVGMIIDRDSVSKQVLNRKFTMGKIIPREHKPNPRFLFGEPLMQMKTITRFLDLEEILEQQQAIAQRLDRETYARALELEQERRKELEETEEISAAILEEILREDDDTSDRRWEKPQRIHLSRSRRIGSSDKMTDIDLEHGGLWSSPLAVKRMVGQHAGSWDARKKKSSPLTGSMLSGEKVLLMHYYYAGETSPDPGYLRLVWKDDEDDQLIGAALNKRDSERLDASLDSADCDDTVSLIFMEEEGGKNPQVLVLRLPMSIDGGACLKINQEDARKLRKLGYHFYRKTGNHEFPNLHDLDEEGKAIHPDVLFAAEIPVEEKPEWTTDESLAMESLLKLNQFKGVIGQVANLTSALDISNLWKPEEAKVNFSGEVVDPATNADKNPRTVANSLTGIIHGYVDDGEPLESTIIDRVERMVQKYHKESGNEEDLNIATVTYPESTRAERGMTRDTGFFNERLNTRQLSANGPVEWLTREFDPEITAEFIQAKITRDKVWEEKRENDRKVRSNEYLSDEKKNSLLAVNAETVRIKEREAVDQAYARVKDHPQYVTGAARAIWTQLSIAAIVRPWKDLKPIALYALGGLPAAEHLEYHEAGLSNPSVTLRPFEMTEFEPGTTVILRQPKKGRYTLTDLKGKEIVRVRAEAKLFMTFNKKLAKYQDLKLKIHGYMADTDPANTVTVEHPILVLEVEPRK